MIGTSITPVPFVQNDGQKLTISFNEEIITEQDGQKTYMYDTTVLDTTDDYNKVLNAILEQCDNISISQARTIARKALDIEPTLEEVKAEKIEEIDAYDTSDAVNGFIHQGHTMWIDKATRVGLVNAIECTMTMGEENITFGIQNVSVTLPCATAMKMMAALEVYALKCYNVTLAHKNAIEELTSIEDVNAFDVSVGYPAKLEF